MKGISVIIPTIHRTDFVLNTLEDLSKQKFEFAYEVLVVDQSKVIDQKVKDFCATVNNMKYYHITFFKGLPEARNFGAANSAYEMLLFLDDDIKCESNLLKEHYAVLQQSDIGVVAGGITEKFEKNKDTKIGVFNKLKAHPLGGFHIKAKKEVDHARGCNFSVKKSVYDEVGGVDENLTVGAALYEETDFCLRVKKGGYKIYFNYDAHIYHLVAPTGGCRVEEIDKYIYSLSRNKTIIISRYLPLLFVFSAKLYLLRLIISYAFAYKSFSVFKAYNKGVCEGKKVGRLPVKRSYA